MTRTAPNPRSHYREPRRGFLWSIYRFFSGLFRLIVTTTVFFGVLIAASYFVFGQFVRGDGVIPAPDLKAHSVTEALEKIKEWNLSLIMVREEPSDTVAKGEIISQEPPVGSIIKKRTPIKVIVSSGPRHVALPTDLSGINSRETGIRLREMGLRVGNVSYIRVPGIPEDTVISTDPPVGTGVPPDSPINLLVISESPGERINVPDLIGLTEEQARYELTRRGLNIARVKEEEFESGIPGLINSQYPVSGTPIKSGEAVDITIQPLF